MNTIRARADFGDGHGWTKDPRLRGAVSFVQEPEVAGVLVSIYIEGLSEHLHGIHVHEKQLTDEIMKDFPEHCCDKLGGHFNGNQPKWEPDYPDGTPHGSYMLQTDRHIGDLCNNVFPEENGAVAMQYVDPLISLHPDSPNCVLDRSIVLHEDPDDQGLQGTIDDGVLKDASMRKVDVAISSVVRKYKDAQKKRESLITGNAGARIACANIIRLVKDE